MKAGNKEEGKNSSAMVLILGKNSGGFHGGSSSLQQGNVCRELL